MISGVDRECRVWLKRHRNRPHPSPKRNIFHCSCTRRRRHQFPEFAAVDPQFRRSGPTAASTAVEGVWFRAQTRTVSRLLRYHVSSTINITAQAAGLRVLLTHMYWVKNNPKPNLLFALTIRENNVGFGMTSCPSRERLDHHLTTVVSDPSPLLLLGRWPYIMAFWVPVSKRTISSTSLETVVVVMRTSRPPSENYSAIPTQHYTKYRNPTTTQSIPDMLQYQQRFPKTKQTVQHNMLSSMLRMSLKKKKM